MKKTADALVNVMKSWVGLGEANGGYRAIIDLYNSQERLPMGYKVSYRDSWCDVTVSAAAIKAGLMDLIGTECSCERHVKIFKERGIWIEDGAVTPKKGWIILYSWRTNKQPNDKWADHIGVVADVKNGVITAIEGNYKDEVGYRLIPVGHGNIRGYAAPKYDAEEEETVSSGLSASPKWKGVVTASSLNVRTWAGTEHPLIKSRPVLPRGTKVDVCDELKAKDGCTWYYVRIDGQIYGFCSGKYVKKVR